MLHLRAFLFECGRVQPQKRNCRRYKDPLPQRCQTGPKRRNLGHCVGVLPIKRDAGIDPFARYRVGDTERRRSSKNRYVSRARPLGAAEQNDGDDEGQYANQDIAGGAVQNSEHARANILVLPNGVKRKMQRLPEQMAAPNTGK